MRLQACSFLSAQPLGSLIGTPPNAVFAAYMADAYNLRIGFAEWAMVGLPVAALLVRALPSPDRVGGPMGGR